MLRGGGAPGAAGVLFEVFDLLAGEGVDGFAGGVGDLQFDVLVLFQLRQVVVDDDAVGRVDSTEGVRAFEALVGAVEFAAVVG